MPEVYNEFFSFGCVQLEVIFLEPSDCWGYLFPIVVLFIVGYESNYGCIIGILQDDN